MNSLKDSRFGRLGDSDYSSTIVIEKMESNSRLIFKFIALSTFFIPLIIFSLLLLKGIPTDIDDHAKFVLLALEHGVWPGNFLYYLVVAAVNFFSKEVSMIHFSSVLVLSAAVAAKFAISKKFMFSELSLSMNRFPVRTQEKFSLVILLFAFSLLFAHNLPVISKKMYLGQFPPNIWHNSTTIFLMPFALLLFLGSYEFILDGNPKRLPKIAVLSVLNILIKPSYFFVFVPTFLLFSLIRFGITKKFYQSCIVVTVGLGCLAISYYYIYNISAPFIDAHLYGRNPSYIKIDFLNVWQYWSDHLLFSFVVSFAFPIIYALFNLKKIKDDLLSRYAITSLFIALMIFMVFSESGPREYHGNFVWQVLVCTYFLFLVTQIFFLRDLLADSLLDIRKGLVLGIYLLHVLSGAVYILKIFYLESVM